MEEKLTAKQLAQMIDHTQLRPDAKESEIKKLCDEAKDMGFCSVCIQPWYVPFAKKELAGSDVKVCTVIGFPQGQNATATKVFEAEQAIRDGADELDMVMNRAALKNDDLDYVYNDIKAVVDASGDKIVKVILETGKLNNEEIAKACAQARRAGADFVKTSTGFEGSGATVDAVRYMKTAAGSNVKVKASGGIRDLETALNMIEAGADRIGASAGVAIVKEAEANA